MKWEKLKSSIEIEEIRGDILDNEEINQVIHHSGQVKEGAIFVAIKGYEVDGHDYILDARNKGAILAVVEKFVDIDIPQVRVKNTRHALADLGACFFDYPSEKLTMIGVTATNGKTSTSFMIEQILRDAGYTLGIIGTVEVKYPGVVIPSILTTPESIVLQEHLFNMYEKGVEVCIMEVSSSAQELDRVRNVVFDYTTFNNVSKEHIEQHGSYERYFEVKRRTITEAPKDSATILNFDYPAIKALKDQTEAQVFGYSLEHESNPCIKNLDLSTGFGKFEYIVSKAIKKGKHYLPKCKLDIELNVAGYHSVMNAFVAITIGLLMGVDKDSIVESMKKYGGVERRFEMIYDEQYKILDDHYANVKNIEITMKTLEKMDYNNLHLLYAIRGSRGAELNRDNAVEMVKWIKKLNPKTFYATKSKDVVGKKDTVRDDEEQAFLEVMESEDISVPVYDELSHAVKEILERMEEGDVLLLAGCQGMDSGAKFAWQYLIDKGLTEDPEKLNKLIDLRIC